MTSRASPSATTSSARKTGQERESAFNLAPAHRGSLLFADGGFWGAEYDQTMQLIDITLITPDKHQLGHRPPSEIAKARIRLVIESLFSNLTRQMRLEDHLAKTTPGLAQRIIQRLLALTLGIYLNIQLGRPPRALAAYDGRAGTPRQAVALEHLPDRGVRMAGRAGDQGVVPTQCRDASRRSAAVQHDRATAGFDAGDSSGRAPRPSNVALP